MTSELRLVWAAATDTGRARPGNEDAAVAEEGLFAVADGMGGHVGGEVASRLAVETLRSSASTDGLVEAVRIANRAILERATDDQALRGMGTTLCALALVEEDDVTRVEVVNVGDSRAYLFRDGELEQITEDHNLVAQLEREGRLTPEEARVHPQRNIITRVLGNDPDVDVDSFPIDPFRGDRFLLCSDGLFNEIEDDEIAAVLRTNRDPQETVDELVRRANERGGRDNITVVLVDVVDDGDKAREASAALAGSTTTSRAEPLVEPDHGGRARAASAPQTEPTPRRFTWRAALFLLVLVAILVAAGGSVWWYGRNTYYVGLDGDRVAIFKGRPGGVLWLDPTLEQRTTLRLDEVPPARRADVRSGREEATLEDARRYVANLREQAEELNPPTTTTTSTTIVGYFPPPTTEPAPAPTAP
jgi:PPM family protein phosphatase